MVPERDWLSQGCGACAFCDAIFMTFGRTFGDGLPVQSLPDSCEGRQPVDLRPRREGMRAPAIATSSNQLQLPTRPGGLKAGSRVGHVRREELEAGGLF